MRFGMFGLATGIFCGCVSSAPDQAEFRREESLVPPFPSTVTGLGIPNAHWVVKAKSQSTGSILRGMRPKDDQAIEGLRELGVDHVLVFKEPKQGVHDIDDLMARYVLKGFDRAKLRNIPFHWKNIPTFEAACVQLVEALRVLHNAALTPGATLYVHCSVGEDRTGLLTALYRRIYEKKSAVDAFREDMCAWGYGDADATKPKEVVRLINENLTPVFAKMNVLIDQGVFTESKLDAEDCDFSRVATPQILASIEAATRKYSTCAELK